MQEQTKKSMLKHLLFFSLLAASALLHPTDPRNVTSPAAVGGEQVVDLDHLIFDVMLTLNPKDFPVDLLQKTPRSKVFQCLGGSMDSLYEFCEIYSHVEGSNAVLPELKCYDKPEKPKEERKDPIPPPLIIAECMLLSIDIADNVTGRIVNDFHFKMGIYGSPLLSDSKKFAIVQDLEPCLASELPLPHPISTYNRTNMNEVMKKNWIVPVPWNNKEILRMGGAANRNESFYQTIMKNLICLTKALLKNGCASATKEP